MAEPEFMEDFDFGIEFADSDDIQTPVEEDVNEERIDTIEEKLDVLLTQLQKGTSSTGELDEYKDIVRIQVCDKLKEVERVILPLLYNLKKNESKEYIYWPNRTDILDKQIQRVLSITRSLEGEM
jgi:hypothetical protein|tara:strand:- start:228 stop:602 length:375 start_codon:yes stop_codon:yes gene_type:complete